MQDLAIANVPMQQFRRLYGWQQALRRGTLFMELEKPWDPCAGMKGDRYDGPTDAYPD